MLPTRDRQSHQEAAGRMIATVLAASQLGPSVGCENAADQSSSERCPYENISNEQHHCGAKQVFEHGPSAPPTDTGAGPIGFSRDKIV
jgi:hypothetical protein